MRDDRENQADHAVGEQFARDARADNLDAAIFDGIAQRAAHFVDRRLLRLFAARLLRDADQHIAGPPNCCSCTSPSPSPPASCACCAISAGPDLACTSISVPPLEVDAEIQPVGEEQDDREDRQHRRDRKADAAELHEIEFACRPARCEGAAADRAR